MTSDVVARIDRVLTVLLGALFTTGATWATVAALAGGWPGIVSMPLYVATVVGAYAVGVPTMLWGWSGRRVSRPVAAVITGLGSLAVMTITIGAGPSAAGALGGFYTYVAAISFLWFPLPVAIAEIVFAGVTYGVALRVTGAPGMTATWIISMGIALGGAGLVGILGARLRRLYVAEAQASERLREADRMKIAFLQSVSHELRTPLASVKGFAETLDARLDQLDQESRVLLIGRLRDSAERLHLLLADLLDVDRLQRAHVEAVRAPVDVVDLVERAVSSVDVSSHDLEVVVRSGTVAVESSKVERVVANLVANAVRHTPAGTRIVVRGEVCDGILRVDVADDGPGLPAGLEQRIFLPFEQGREASRAPSPGVGLGLAIVERFVAMHDGRVWTGPGLDGAGTTFHVEIPGSVGAAAPAASAAG